MKKYTAFHWSRNDDCLGYGDGRKIVLGETLSVEGKPVKCKHGLHGSESIIDALGYAAGSHLWVVEIWGAVDATDDDKICGQHRKAIAEYGDLMFLVVDFAKWCADRAAEYAEHAEYAAHAAEHAEYAAHAAEYAAHAAKYAAHAAEYAAHAAKYAAAKERLAQENWWSEKLAQIK